MEVIKVTAGGVEYICKGSSCVAVEFARPAAGKEGGCAQAWGALAIIMLIVVAFGFMVKAYADGCNNKSHDTPGGWL